MFAVRSRAFVLRAALFASSSSCSGSAAALRTDMPRCLLATTTSKKTQPSSSPKASSKAPSIATPKAQPAAAPKKPKKKVSAASHATAGRVEQLKKRLEAEREKTQKMAAARRREQVKAQDAKIKEDKAETIEKIKEKAADYQDPNAPKRPVSPFSFFLKESLKQAKPPVAPKMKAAAASWKAMLEDQKKPYLQLAQVDRARYEQQKREFAAKTLAPPKHPLSSFLRFANEQRAQLLTQSPFKEMDKRRALVELSKAIGAKWVALPAAEKAKYISQTQAEQQTYLAHRHAFIEQCLKSFPADLRVALAAAGTPIESLIPADVSRLPGVLAALRHKVTLHALLRLTSAKKKRLSTENRTALATVAKSKQA